MTPAGPPEATDAPPELRTQFWLIVGALNVAILATALGLFVLVFWSRLALGVALLGLGVATFAFSIRRYRQVRDGPLLSE